MKQPITDLSWNHVIYAALVEVLTEYMHEEDEYYTIYTLRNRLLMQVPFSMYFDF